MCPHISPHSKYRCLAPPCEISRFLQEKGHPATGNHGALLESLGAYFREEPRPWQLQCRTLIAGHMCQVLANSAKPRYILVGLHGMNGNPSDFMSFASDVLRKADSKHIGMTVVLPYAFKEASANKRSSKSKKWDHGGFRWWDLVDEGIVGKIKGVVETVNGAPAELPDVCKEIQRIVDEACCVLKLPDSCVSVVGFSMVSLQSSFHAGSDANVRPTVLASNPPVGSRNPEWNGGVSLGP